MNKCARRWKKTLLFSVDYVFVPKNTKLPLEANKTQFVIHCMACITFKDIIIRVTLGTKICLVKWAYNIEPVYLYIWSIQIYIVHGVQSCIYFFSKNSYFINMNTSEMLNEHFCKVKMWHLAKTCITFH